MTTHRILPGPVNGFPSNSQRGGITIVMALILLTVMGAGAFTLSQNTLRELAITGSVSQQAKAENAADAGLDWFVVWAHPENVIATASASATSGHAYMAKNMLDILRGSSVTSFTVTSSENNARDASSVDDLVFDNNATPLSQKFSGGNQVVQAIDVNVRWLGTIDIPLTGGGGNASGGTNPNAVNAKELIWLARSTGRASVDPDPTSSDGNRFIRYRSTREMIASSLFTQQ